MGLTKGQKIATFLFMSVNSDFRKAVDLKTPPINRKELTDRLRAAFVAQDARSDKAFDDEITNGTWTPAKLDLLLVKDTAGTVVRITSDQKVLLDALSPYPGGQACPDFLDSPDLFQLMAFVK